MPKPRDGEVTANQTYKNWRAFAQGEPCVSVVESQLYTDALILGELTGLGPHSFINTIAHHRSRDSRSPRPAIVLRIAIHGHGQPPPVQLADDFDHYHGGDFVDAMTAIASLFLGIRLKAGPVDREFISGGDPYGRPIQYGLKAAPELPPFVSAPQIPRLSAIEILWT